MQYQRRGCKQLGRLGKGIPHRYSARGKGQEAVKAAESVGSDVRLVRWELGKTC